MSQPRYQVHLQNYNFDKTKLTKNVRPKIYSDVASANTAAHDWLQHLRSEYEVVRIVKIGKEGMIVQATVNVKDRENIFSWAEVVRVREVMNEAGEGASVGGEEAEK
jgi:hypothetical protein